MLFVSNHIYLLKILYLFKPFGYLFVTSSGCDLTEKLFIKISEFEILIIHSV